MTISNEAEALLKVFPVGTRVKGYPVGRSTKLVCGTITGTKHGEVHWRPDGAKRDRSWHVGGFMTGSLQALLDHKAQMLAIPGCTADWYTEVGSQHDAMIAYWHEVDDAKGA